MRSLAKEFEESGGYAVDAPVTGSLDSAIRGDMIMFVGGSEIAVEKAKQFQSSKILPPPSFTTTIVSSVRIAFPSSGHFYCVVNKKVQRVFSVNIVFIFYLLDYLFH